MARDCKTTKRFVFVEFCHIINHHEYCVDDKLHYTYLNSCYTAVNSSNAFEIA